MIESRRQQYLNALHHILETRFDEGDLHTLCFKLAVDYDSLPGQGKADKARDLIVYLEHRRRIPDLLALGKKGRPDIAWEDLAETTGEAQSTFQSAQYEQPPKSGEAAPDHPAEDASAFARDIRPDRRALIVARMSKTVDELDAYIEQYGRAISAHRLSAILYERTKKLQSLQPTEEGWGGHWEAVEQIYDELESLAFGMSTWKETRRPKPEPSDITTDLQARFGTWERSVLDLIDQYTEAHDRAQALTAQLRQSQGDRDDGAVRALREKVKGMQTSADNMCRELYLAITALIKKELNAQLAALGQPRGRS
jgi:hypothetical protein